MSQIFLLTIVCLCVGEGMHMHVCAPTQAQVGATVRGLPPSFLHLIFYYSYSHVSVHSSVHTWRPEDSLWEDSSPSTTWEVERGLWWQ